MTARIALAGLVACIVLGLAALIPSAFKAGEEIASTVDSIPSHGAAVWDVETWVVTAMELPAIPRAQQVVHAARAHDEPDVEAIRRCYDGGNPVFQLWREKDKITYHCFFELPDGRLGDRIIAKDHQGWFERTAFVPKDGTWKSILDWLMRKGAARYTGPVK